MPTHTYFRMSPYKMICFIGFFAVSSFSMLSPILSLYAKDSVGATIVEIGVITSAFFIASAVVKIPLGIAGGGSKTLMLFALSLLFLSVLPYFYTLAQTTVVLAFVRVVHGIAFTLAITLSLILVPLTVPEYAKNRAVAAYSLTTGAGLAVGSAIGVLSIAFGELRSVFYVGSVFALPGFILGYIFTKKLYAIEKRWLLLERPIQHDVSSKLKHVLTNSMFLVAFLACLAHFFSFGAILAYAPLYATQKLFLSHVDVASMFFGCYLLTALARLPLRRLISSWRFSKEMLVLSAQVMAVLLAFAPSLGVQPTVFALVIVLFGVSQGIIYPVGAMIASETVSPAEQVLANSLYLVAWDLGLALGPALTSTIASTSGILSAIATSSILPAISAITLFYTMLRKTGKQP